MRPSTTSTKPLATAGSTAGSKRCRVAYEVIIRHNLHPPHSLIGHPLDEAGGQLGDQPPFPFRLGDGVGDTAAVVLRLSKTQCRSRRLGVWATRSARKATKFS